MKTKKLSYEEWLSEWSSRAHDFIDAAFAPCVVGLITVEEAIERGCKVAKEWEKNDIGYYTEGGEEYYEEDGASFDECIRMQTEQCPNWAISSGCVLFGLFPEGAEEFHYAQEKIKALKEQKFNNKNSEIMAKGSKGTRSNISSTKDVNVTFYTDKDGDTVTYENGIEYGFVPNRNDKGIVTKFQVFRNGDYKGTFYSEAEAKEQVKNLIRDDKGIARPDYLKEIGKKKEVQQKIKSELTQNINQMPADDMTSTGKDGLNAESVAKQIVRTFERSGYNVTTEGNLRNPSSYTIPHVGKLTFKVSYDHTELWFTSANGKAGMLGYNHYGLASHRTSKSEYIKKLLDLL